MTNFDEKFWFVPPYLHRRNTAERAIETFKNHFIDGISSVNKDFPMHIWFRLILQACLALNLLRQSRINPKFLLMHKFMEHIILMSPLLRLQELVWLFHKKPAVRGIWAIRWIDGWSLGHAIHHYIRFEVFANNTAHSHIAETVEFFCITSPLLFHHQQTTPQKQKKTCTCFTKSIPKHTILVAWRFHNGSHKTTISRIEDTNRCNTGSINFSRHLQTSITKNNHHNPQVTSSHTPHQWKWWRIYHTCPQSYSTSK